MCLTARPNEYASKAVIVLQLATWSAVGIILLQKGASSLHRSNAASVRNDSFAQMDVTAEAQIEIRTFDLQRRYEDEDLNLAVISLQDDSSAMITERRPARFDRQTTRSEDLLDDSQKNADDTHREADPTRAPAKKKKHQIPAVNRKESDSLSARPSAHENKQDQELLKLAEDFNEGAESTNDDSGEDDKSERGGRMGDGPPEVKAARATAPAGTVAAIAMLAVGAVMLVLGPAAVILRALDDRRQKRRFLKLSAADDLPPTYEQATLMDEAPRYSTLVLNRSDSAFSMFHTCAAVASIEQDEGSSRHPVEAASSGS